MNPVDHPRNRKGRQSAEATSDFRAIDLARLHSPRPAQGRRTQAPDRRRRAARHDLESRRSSKRPSANPTLYQDFLDSLANRADLDAKGRYELLAIRDIQDAADLLTPGLQEHQPPRRLRQPGGLSLPRATTPNGTLDEARRLWTAVGRANVMIKVPGTPEGIPAFRQLISEGINVNVTLLFAQDVYEEVAARLHRRSRDATPPTGGDVGRDRQRGQLLHQPHRHPGRFARRRANSRPRPIPRRKGKLQSIWAKSPSPTAS